MTFVSQYAFNLLFNSAFSFFAGVFVVWLSLRIFRVERSQWKLALLCLPFVKILWDLSYRGIPSTSLIYTGINPLSLPPKSQMLSIGAGFSKFGQFSILFLQLPDSMERGTP